MAEMEAHNQAPQVDTAQRRAAAIQFIKENFSMHLCEDGEPLESDVADVMDFAQQARREALDEAARVAIDYNAFTGFGYCDELGPEYDHTRSHAYGRGCHQTIRGIADAIDRLREER